MANFNFLNSFIPGYIYGNTKENTDKILNDSYNVYVNDDYVGSKILYSEVENVSDVSEYLKSNGFGDFTYEEQGNTLKIQDDNDQEAEKMKKQLDVYLNIR
ncbi:MAG: hypothetical protein ACERKV_13975 [Clostridiaceae bacterium]